MTYTHIHTYIKKEMMNEQQIINTLLYIVLHSIVYRIVHPIVYCIVPYCVLYCALYREQLTAGVRHISYGRSLGRYELFLRETGKAISVMTAMKKNGIGWLQLI